MLCSDKTGTLTLNKLSIEAENVMPCGAMDKAEIMKMGALSANTITEEPIDMVLWESYPDRVSVAIHVFVRVCSCVCLWSLI